jgi:hypothetical protein
MIQQIFYKTVKKKDSVFSNKRVTFSMDFFNSAAVSQMAKSLHSEIYSKTFLVFLFRKSKDLIKKLII